VVLSREISERTDYELRGENGGLGGGSSEEAVRIGRPRRGSGAVPATLTMNGTVGRVLIDPAVRAHSSSQVKHPSKAMPMGPVTAHMSNAIMISPLRHDIIGIVSRTLPERPYRVTVNSAGRPIRG
jgi:hypothetical protein